MAHNNKQRHYLPERKQCFKCNTTLPLKDFSKSKDHLDGYSNECKKCCNARKLLEKAAREQRKANIKAGNVKVCTRCHRTKAVDDFSADAPMCKLCTKRFPPLTQKDYLNRYLPKKHRRR